MQSLENLSRHIDDVLSRLSKAENYSLPINIIYSNFNEKDKIQLDIALCNYGLIEIRDDSRRLSYAGRLVCSKGGWIKEMDSYRSHKIVYSLALNDFKNLYRNAEEEAKFVKYQRVINELDKYYVRLESLLEKHLYGGFRFNMYMSYLDDLKKKDKILNNEAATEDLLALMYILIGVTEQMRQNESGESTELQLKALTDENEKLLAAIYKQNRKLKMIKTEQAIGSTIREPDHPNNHYKIGFHVLLFVLGSVIVYQSHWIPNGIKVYVYISLVIILFYFYFRDTIPNWVNVLVGFLLAILAIIAGNQSGLFS
jgi:hypothetical protein